MSEPHDSVSMDDDVLPENVPLPTSSMITVRLSDCQSEQVLPIDACTPPESPRLSSPNSPQSLPSRPRSISVATTTSAASTGSAESGAFSAVDWEGLEKTEEQEPKDEATDEVRPPAVPFSYHH